MLVALSSPGRNRVEAKDAAKGCSYICPNCKSAVVFARGTKIRWHFKHAKDSTCSYGGESWQHEAAKAAILEGARDRNLTAAPELEVLSIDGDRRADVIIWGPKTERLESDDERRLAIEVQYSPINCGILTSRTRAYMAAAVPIIWIPVIDKEKFKSLEVDNRINLFRIRGYSAPVWIRTIANLQGHLWIFVPQTNAFWRGWLLPHWLYKSPSEGYDSNGEYHASGGYWYEASIKRDLYLQGPFQFASLKLARVNCSANSLVSPNGSVAYLVDLVPEGDVQNKAAPVRKQRKPNIVAGRDTGFYTYEDWVKLGEEWALAQFGGVAALTSMGSDQIEFGVA